MLDFLILIAGFILLIKGADFFVDGSSSVAKRLKVPPLIIGMTIVAMGTSLPETSVSVSAAISGNNELAISNAVGSNIFNLMIVCGLCALFCTLKIGNETLKRDFPISILAAVVLLIMGGVDGMLGRLDGIILLAMFAVFLWLMIRSARKSRQDSQNEGGEYKILPVWQCTLYVVGGAAAIAVGGKLVVMGASEIALAFGMSSNLVGLTIVAFGTSLPELVTSVVAARKNQVDMALGNVVGSNIFNILLVLGVAAAISPVGFTAENMVDTLLLVAMSTLVLIFCLAKKKLVNWQGAVMIMLYAGFTGYIIVR